MPRFPRFLAVAMATAACSSSGTIGVDDHDAGSAGSTSSTGGAGTGEGGLVLPDGAHAGSGNIAFGDASSVGGGGSGSTIDLDGGGPTEGDATVPCQKDDVCWNDSFCVSGECVRFGAGGTDDRDFSCEVPPKALDAFVPAIQCEWPGKQTVEHPGNLDVYVPPLVVDLDGDAMPEIVFSTWDLSGTTPYPSYIRAIRGDDCTPVWTSTHSNAANQSIVVGDLTGDGKPEVCGRSNTFASECTPYCLGPDGKLLWEAHDAAGDPVRVGCSPLAHELGIAIANVDGKGEAELVIGLSVFDGPTGKLVKAIPHPTVAKPDWFWAHFIPALADVDGDGHVEALVGDGIYDLVTGALDDDWGRAPGFTALAELDKAHDGPETVVVSTPASEIRVHALDGTVIFEAAVPGGNGGPPTIADFDGDGYAEFATAALAKISVFDLDCVPSVGRGGDCASGTTDGIVWSKDTHEFTSGFTGSSAFDFEGDGAIELVYADECWARVYDGATGKVKFSTAHESSTGVESPVIADVDGDGHTEIVVPHGLYQYAATNGACPSEDPQFAGAKRESGRRYRGISVLRDEMDRWAPSRPIWDQHTYHIDERNDDGTVPTKEPKSWESHNSYRQQVQSEGRPGYKPDVTVGPVDGPDCDERKLTQVLEADVCNRGLSPLEAGVAVAFHIDSEDGETLCSTKTKSALEPTICEVATCTWEGVPLQEEHDVFAVATGAEGECNENNDVGTGEMRCPRKTVK